jgi:aspartate kinase
MSAPSSVQSAGRPLTVVQKYGGSSVADIAKIHQVAAHIAATRRAGKRVVAVVSAMGKTTDGLMQLAHEVSASPDRRELDMLLTAGERIAMALVAMSVRDQGFPATSLTGSQCGILTNDAPGGARILEVRPFRVEDALDQGQVVIVAGFQGTSWRREVTTLGRGGSDTTAVALAGALGADCEIYSDVDGIYSADPRVVSAAVRRDVVSHDETLALARAGAKVLAADAVAYARVHGIALYARRTAGGNGETVVRLDAPRDRPWVTAVAARPETVVLRYGGEGDADAVVASALQQALVAPLAHLGDEPRVLVVARDAADAVDPAFERLIAALQGALGARQLGTERGTLVSIVGPAVGREAGLTASFREAAGPHSWWLQHGLTLSALVEPGRAADAVRALHRRFVEGMP